MAVIVRRCSLRPSAGLPRFYDPVKSPSLEDAHNAWDCQRTETSRRVGVGRASQSRVAECWRADRAKPGRKYRSIVPTYFRCPGRCFRTGLDANAQCEMRPPSGPDVWISRGRKRTVASANASHIHQDNDPFVCTVLLLRRFDALSLVGLQGKCVDHFGISSILSVVIEFFFLVI